jgi:hypothetical protein
MCVKFQSELFEKIVEHIIGDAGLRLRRSRETSAGITPAADTVPDRPECYQEGSAVTQPVWYRRDPRAIPFPALSSAAAPF